jgi:hypothetical protein
MTFISGADERMQYLGSAKFRPGRTGVTGSCPGIGEDPGGFIDLQVSQCVGALSRPHPTRSATAGLPEGSSL